MNEVLEAHGSKDDMMGRRFVRNDRKRVPELGEELATVDEMLEQSRKYKKPCMAAVYNNPPDCPGYAICRLYILDKPTLYYVKRKTVEEIREEFEGTDTMWFDRADTDASCLVGSYFL